MKTISIPAKAIHAATLFQAKGDARYYLNGICLQKSGHVAGTNGHLAIRVECEAAQALEEDKIIAINGKIPPKADTAQLVFFESKQEGYMYFDDGLGIPVEKNGARELCGFKVIDGKFPDITKVIPKGKLTAVDEIGFNLDYAATIGKAIKVLGLKIPQAAFKFRGANQSIEVEANTPNGKATIILMPSRL